DDAQRAAAVARLRMLGELRRAIDEREFRLRYQPVISLSSGEVVGLEALLRWEHPVRGLLTPAGFMQVAEHSGLIVEIGAWVLDEACRQAAALADDGTPIDMAVNVSARQLTRPELIGHVRHAL